MKNYIINYLNLLLNKKKKIEKLFLKKNINLNKKNIFLLTKKYFNIKNICNYYIQWKLENNKIKSTKKFLKDIELSKLAKEEINKYLKEKKILEYKIKKILIPKSKEDKLGCFIEIKAGTGGIEASLFVGNLFRMYSKYCENKNWNLKILSLHENEKGGYKQIIINIPNNKVYYKLKFESGGHRVQRIPETENMGRIHTSSCTVAVIPEIPKKKLPKINLNDIKIDTFKSSGAGGQHVNTTDSAIRITHIPTGIVVECQDERSQHKNKSKALNILGSRLKNNELEKQNQKKSKIKKKLLGTGDRSDRIRTYNFHKNRITDHRINITLYKLNEIMEGNLDIIIKYIINQYENSKIKSIFKI